ncbi:MAG: zinc metalloprotease HtpX [Gammaproteobacteria bacterium]|nr:zinc metalloprotease HtpX [Gammaproteobacteria bacterium]
MNNNIHQFSTANWRKQLRINDRRTKITITLFVLIYLSVGLLIDLYIHAGPVRTMTGEVVKPPLGLIFHALITLQITPYATIIMGIVAIISILITFSLHDKLILLGTEYKQITDSATSMEEKQLYNVVEEMKTAAGLRYMPKVYLIDADYMNAFASGYSEKSALIAITKGLVNKLNRSELQAVIAHELSHIKHHDIKLTLMASVLSNIMLIAIDILFYSVIFGRDRDSDNRLATIIIILRFVLPILTVLLMLYLSRTREYMADAGAVELTRDNTPLADALLKISGDHQQHAATYGNQYLQTPHEDVRRAAYIFDPVQAGIEPMKSVASLFSTHPSIKDRLKALGFKYNVS